MAAACPLLLQPVASRCLTAGVWPQAAMPSLFQILSVETTANLAKAALACMATVRAPTARLYVPKPAVGLGAFSGRPRNVTAFLVRLPHRERMVTPEFEGKGK